MRRSQDVLFSATMPLITSHLIRALRSRPERVAGAMLMALGTSTTVGWLTRHPALFEFVHGLVPMVFNTGALFFLIGTALILSPESAAARTTRAVVCLAVAALSAITLAEHALDLDLSVNLSSLHTWYDYGNTRPGRMAPNTALAFLLMSVVVPLADHVRGRKRAIATVVLTFAVMTIGLVGLVGYFLEPELLFGWARSARMAVHTAAGVIVAGAGIWLSWSRSDWYRGGQIFHEGAKIRGLSAAVLVVATITAGLTGFVLLQRGFEASLEGRLAAAAGNRGPWLHALALEIANNAASDAQVAGLPLAGRMNEHASSGVDLERAARELLRLGARSVSFGVGQENVLVKFGARSEVTDFEAPLDGIGRISLIWDHELRVRTRHVLGLGVAQLRSGKGATGAEWVEIESAAPQIPPLLFGVAGLGVSAEVTACRRRAEMLVCLPDAYNTVPFTVPIRKPPLQPLPMQLALSESRPGIVRGLDYRGHSVIAAYASLAPGLGYVSKQDAAEAYAPIREALASGAPVMLLLAAAGALAMYSQIDPLVHRMRRSERQTAAALARNVAIREAVSDGILTIDGEGRIESSNAAAQSMLGFAAAELEGRDFFSLLPRQAREQQRKDFAAAVDGTDPAPPDLRSQEINALRRDATEFPMELTLNAVPEPRSGAAIATSERLFVAVIRDITARRMTEEVLSRMAKFDALTGLANRALFHDRLRTAMARAVRSGNPLALMFLDLDGFKAINDEHGHLAGDELLKQVAARLTGVVRKTDTVARLAGDEFTIVLEDLKKVPDDVKHVAEKAVHAMRGAFQVDGNDVFVTVSVGIVVHDPRSDGAVDMSDLLKRADQSMYEVKRAGKNGFSVSWGAFPTRDICSRRDVRDRKSA